MVDVFLLSRESLIFIFNIDYQYRKPAVYAQRTVTDLHFHVIFYTGADILP